MRDLSIIIVNHNAKELLRNCLKSIFQRIKNIDFEVWLVDNASKDGSLEMVKKEFPEVEIIANKENIGFARATNKGIKKSTGKYVFLLNPDTLILDENCKKLIEFMEERLDAGACGPLILNSDGTIQRLCKRSFPTFWNSFTYYLRLWKLFPKNRWWRKNFGKYFLLDKPDDKICEVGQLHGAAMIVRKSILERVGLMNEEYFLYWDDTDWCFNMRTAAWKVYYVPLAKILHHEGAGGVRLRPFMSLWYFHRGAHLFYKRYLAPHCFFLFNFFYYIGVWFAFGLKIIFILLGLAKKKIQIFTRKFVENENSSNG